MILLLDTSTPVCKLALYDKGALVLEDNWEAARDLAEQLLEYLERQLASQQKTLDDISGIGVYKGPGSFTGLRIGLAVINTIADTNKVAIVGETGDDWREKVLRRLNGGEDERIVLPLYGREANITKPRK